MAQPLVTPIKFSFDGGDAERHLVDASQLGQSLQGTARLYNSVAHYWFHGEVAQRLVAPQMRILVGPPTEGSVFYIAWLVMNQGLLPTYPQVLCMLGDAMIPKLVKGIFAKRAGRISEMEKALDVIQEIASQNTELAKLMHAGHLQDKAALYGVLDRLTSSNTGSLRSLAAPVGPSVKSITYFKGTPEEHVVDEPTAEVFRAKEELIVGDAAPYRGKIYAVDKIAGTCRFEIEGAEKPIRGKITDPSLAAAPNVYTHALDTDTAIEVTGKPVSKDGEITTLYISDARAV